MGLPEYENLIGGEITRLAERLAAEPGVELAVLVGSRALGKGRPDSDWDIALGWVHDIDTWELLGRTETLRRGLAQAIGVAEASIDLIDLRRAGLAMRAAVAEEGVVLKGEDEIVWNRFLVRTWRELEEFYWEQRHAA